MAEITVGQLARQTNKDADVLLTQLKSFGIEKSSQEDVLTAAEMKTLLEKINSSKVTPAVKKTTSTMRVGGQHKINVSVKRKRRTDKTVTAPVATTSIGDNASQTVKDVAAVPKASDPKVATLVSVSSNKETKPSVAMPQKSVAAAKEAPKAVAKEPVAKPAIKTGGFNFTSIPKKPVVTENTRTNVAPAAKKAPVKKVFSNDSSGSNTKYKKDADNRNKGQKAPGKGLRGANSRQLSQMSGDGSYGGFGKKRFKAPKVDKQEFTKPVEVEIRTVVIHNGVTVSDLAQKMAVKGAEIVKILFNMGVMATINQSLDEDTAILIVEEMGHKYTLHNENALEEAVTIVDRTGTEKMTRAPVVTIMGHVDHGKTSLLDYIRDARVVDGEAGGITQHIGAYSVETNKGSVTFLDTPGHEAFTSMRARGAKATDIVILVVAADDGVMPQTEEAIQHAKAAGVPIIVAVNKIDKPEADPEKVVGELAQRDVMPESWGGDVMFANVSAKTGEGVDALLDAILLQSEVLELDAFSDGHAEGVVVESRLEKGRGPVATVLVQNGSLNQGDIVLCGTEFGRVRAMHDDTGKKITTAGPSTPVEIIGLSGVPAAGDEMIVSENEKKAKEVAVKRSEKRKESKISQEQALKLSNMFGHLGKEGEQQTLNVILKGDVQGSVEAIRESLNKLSTDNVKVNIIVGGIGGITSSDITLAVASTAVVIGFNVRADSAAKKLAELDGVELRYYNIIYDLIDDIRSAMTGMLSPDMKEQIVGIAQVREVYRSTKFGSIAGCMVIEGTVKRANPIRVLRDSVVIYEGSLESLKRFKEDATEVKKGIECGIGVKNYNDVRDGDQIEVYEIIEVAKEL